MYSEGLIKPTFRVINSKTLVGLPSSALSTRARSRTPPPPTAAKKWDVNPSRLGRPNADGESDQQLPVFTPERSSHPPCRASQSPRWTSRRRGILYERSCLLVRTTPLACWPAWVFQSPPRESRFTLRLRRGFCFLNKNFPTIGYPSIKCEYVAQTWIVLLIKGIVVRHWQNELSIPSLIKHEPSPQPTSLSFIRTGLEGRVTGYTEVPPPTSPQSIGFRGL